MKSKELLLKKGWIFDMDGVLTKTDIYHFKSFKKVLKDEGLYIRDSEIKAIRGIRREVAMKMLLEKYGANIKQLEKLSDLCEKKNNEYLRIIETITPKDLIEGTKELFDLLKKHNIKIALASISLNSKFLAKKLGILEYFDQITNPAEVKNPKPNSEIFLKSVKELGLKESDCLVVEDSIESLIELKNTDIKCVAITQDKNIDIDLKFKSVNELYRKIKNNNE